MPIEQHKCSHYMQLNAPRRRIVSGKNIITCCQIVFNYSREFCYHYHCHHQHNHHHQRRQQQQQHHSHRRSGKNYLTNHSDNNNNNKERNMAQPQQATAVVTKKLKITTRTRRRPIDANSIYLGLLLCSLLLLCGLTTQSNGSHHQLVSASGPIQCKCTTS